MSEPSEEAKRAADKWAERSPAGPETDKAKIHFCKGYDAVTAKLREELAEHVRISHEWRAEAAKLREELAIWRDVYPEHAAAFAAHAAALAAKQG